MLFARAALLPLVAVLVVAPPPPPAGALPIPQRVAALLAQMNATEKIAQLIYGGAPQDVPALLARFPYGTGSIIAGPGNPKDFPAWRNAVQAAFLNASRLKIPVSFYQETMRSAGVGGSTLYPVGAGLGATWNVSALYAIGRAIAEETSALGVDRSLSPVIQVATDARWGRLQENFGELPAHTGALGAAMARGLLGPNSLGGADSYLNDTASIVVTAKHALAYGESSTDGYTTDASVRKVMDTFLRPWRELALVGGRGMMASHEALNWVPMHANSDVLDGLLRQRLGFGNALIGSDNLNVNWLYSAFHYSPSEEQAAIDAITAGVDQEMGSGWYTTYLPGALAGGRVDPAVIDRAAGNVLRAKFAAGLFDSPFVDPGLAPAVVHSAAHVALTRSTAAESIVVLANKAKLLPLDLSRFANIAVLGPTGGGCSPDVTQSCAARLNQDGNYGDNAQATYLVEDALRASLPSANITYARGADIDSWQLNRAQLDAAVALAEASDLVLLVLGDSSCNGGGSGGFGGCTCGEGADRTSLDLPGSQQLLLQAVLNVTGNLADAPLPTSYQYAGMTALVRPGGVIPVVVILIHGRPVTFDSANRNWLLPPTLLSAWLPAEQGGLAIVDVLSGAINPSGRLAQAWPRSAGHLRGPSSPSWQQPNSQGTGPFFEPRNDDGSWAPLFPLLAGESYTSFAFSALSSTPAGPIPINASWAADAVVLTLTITAQNTGAHDGAVVVAAFFNVLVPKVLRYVRALASFTKVFLRAGESVPVSLPVRRIDIDRWDEALGDWLLDAGNYDFFVGDCWSSGGLYAGEAACAQQTVKVALSAA